MAYAKTNMDTPSIFWDEQLCTTISLIHCSSKKLEKYGKKVREKERQLKSKHKYMWKSKYDSEVGHISKEIRELIRIYESLNEEDEEKDREAGFQRDNRLVKSANFIKRPRIQEDDENAKTIKLLKERHEYEKKVKTLEESVSQLNANNSDLQSRVESLQSQLKNEKQEQKDRRKSFEAQFEPNEPEKSFERRNRSYQSDPPSKRFNRHEYEEKVRTLEEIVRQLNADNQDLQQRTKSNLSIRHECEENVRKLQENIRQLNAEKLAQQKSFDEQLQNFQTNEPKEDFHRRNPSYQSDPPSKRFNRHEYEEKVRTLEEIVRTLNADNQDLQSSVEAQFKTNEPEESFERRNRSYQSDSPSKRFKGHEYEKKIKRLEETVRQLNADNQVLQTRFKRMITQLEEEKLDLQTRLSAVIGSRIKDGNPDIADLSDENRPTKLAEMLSELYDNEWTDCFEESIETKSEEYGREKELLKILMDIFNVCFEWSTEKYFLHVQRAIDRTYLDGKHCSDEKEEVVLPKDLQQPIKEFKKKRALQVLPTIHRLVRNRLPDYSHNRFATTVYQAYIQQCIKFSWLAVVQDPPMALNAEGGTAFNKKQFKEYMCRGEYVEFVVWPSLHLTSGGNLLAKGVAQGTNSKATAL